MPKKLSVRLLCFQLLGLSHIDGDFGYSARHRLGARVCCIDYCQQLAGYADIARYWCGVYLDSVGKFCFCDKYVRKKVFFNTCIFWPVTARSFGRPQRLRSAVRINWQSVLQRTIHTNNRRSDTITANRLCYWSDWQWRLLVQLSTPAH